ncbi:MAG: chorismate synthase [Candidatus Thermoplasmatota archaeon]|jgi:chorismate synthase|nr:chorismate synthase [Candidatus Thermoplasmatota archaeon]
MAGIANLIIARLEYGNVSFTTGNSIRFTVFGESHGPAIGGVLDGLPSGFEINTGEIAKWMDRRRPGQSEITTRRSEPDTVKIISGVTEGYTNGGPVAFYIENSDVMSEHYSELEYKPRPGHADITMYEKFGKHRPYAGGGFASGRLTAPLVAAGSICMQVLFSHGVSIISYIDRIGGVSMENTPACDQDYPYTFKTRIPDTAVDTEAHAAIIRAMGEGDSLGSSIQTIVTGIKPGVGEPFFNSVESEIAKMMFSIPGIKGVEFGKGFGFSASSGSNVKDEMHVEDGGIRFNANNNGGVLGGISNGMPITFRVAVKPTSSIRKEENTVDLRSMTNSTIRIQGRHDPCIGIRALPVVQTSTAIVLLDLLFAGGYLGRIHS